MIDVKSLKERVTDGTQGARYLKQLADLAYLRKYPFQGTFELTPLCNFLCPMCYVHMNQVEHSKLLTTEQWIAIAKSAMDAGTIEISLTGGEPLMHPGFSEIYTTLHKMGMIITILSNASLMDDDFFKLMENYPPRAFSISIYGYTPQTYERMCGHPEACDIVKQNILRIKRMNQVSLRVKTTVVKQNIQDVPQLLEWAESEGITYNVFTYLDLPRAETQRCIDEYALSAEEEIKFWSFYQERLEKKQKFNTMQFENELFEQMNQHTIRTDKGFHCTAGSNRYWINWKGEMLACALLDKPSCNVLEKSVSDSFRKISEECAELPGLGLTACKDCSMRATCRPCPASHYLETGSYGILSERICQRQKLFLEQQCYVG